MNGNNSQLGAELESLIKLPPKSHLFNRRMIKIFQLDSQLRRKWSQADTLRPQSKPNLMIANIRSLGSPPKSYWAPKVNSRNYLTKMRREKTMESISECNNLIYSASAKKNAQIKINDRYALSVTSNQNSNIKRHSPRCKSFQN